MFRHLSAPSRAARQKGCTAEPWKAKSPNWDPNTPTRSPRLNLAVVLKKQGKLEEAGLRSLGLGARRGCGSVEGKAVLEWPGQGTGEFLVSKFHRSNLKILLMRSLILHVGLVLVSLL